jgi:hypothetical protein
MFKRTMIALFSLGVVMALFGITEAGCLRMSNGTQYCAAWITGSEICQVNIQGHIDSDQPTVRCSASAIEGVSFCLNPASKSRKGALQGQAFTLTVPLEATTDVQSCNKQTGICSAEIALDPDPETTPGLCTNENWVFVTLTAAHFTGRVDVCTSGLLLDALGNPILDSSGNAQCVDAAAPGTLIESCTVDLEGYRPGDRRAYTCVPAS